ncbi:intraflagellar transport protein [Tritrichomonas foetus]|uniref:Intraflagellar transport protein n=1 Tax=Tritrichomonas foetus TaxID=1144522 RepID=A0A1J4J3Y3_9EUKA|nr:intraflagellar transport protein [Tritrichomonas foetus]|eukprot:OHS92871.1 intraflagellar transport protein [Tritrichomonas foetus]
MSDEDDINSGLDLNINSGMSDDGNYDSLMQNSQNYQPYSLNMDDNDYNNTGSYDQYKSTYQNSDPGDDLTGASSDMASLFMLISKFQPEPVEITVHWKPFIPELVPAIGSIDAFIKVPRPDGEMDDLGLVIVDEPSISQSNPQILRMELREQYGVNSPANEGDGYIGFIEDPQKNRKALTSWLESIEEVHRNRPPPTFIYSSKMPELEQLMEPWPEEFEETLNSVPLPSADMDLSFEDYAKVICSLLEIPVHGNIVESLHHLFSLYAQFEGNQYFQSQRAPTPTK